MTIHHDKLAYGRLKGLNDEMSADEIAKLVQELNDEDDGQNADTANTEKDDTAQKDKK